MIIAATTTNINVCFLKISKKKMFIFFLQDKKKQTCDRIKY